MMFSMQLCKTISCLYTRRAPLLALDFDNALKVVKAAVITLIEYRPICGGMDMSDG